MKRVDNGNTSHTKGTDHLNIQGYVQGCLGTPGKDFLLRSKASDSERFRCLDRIYPKMIFILGRKFFVAGSICARALSVTKVDVWEGSVAVGVRTKVVQVDTEQIFRVVRPASRGT